MFTLFMYCVLYFLLFCFFFFYSSVDHRDLHSLPTRRSSDLFVKARAILENPDLFDAAFFNVNPKEAEILDPQHRVFLERSEEHTSELQSRLHLVCRLLLEKKKKKSNKLKKIKKKPHHNANEH